MHTPSLEGEPRPRVRRKGFFARILEALHRSRRREAIRVLRRHRHLMAGQAQVRSAKPAPESRQTEKSSRHAHGITRPRAPRTPRPDSRDVTPPSVTALAIIAALILILHIAASAVLADVLAHASPSTPDDDAASLGDASLDDANLGDAKPSAPALPFDQSIF